jgi:hypothetical protein
MPNCEKMEKTNIKPSIETPETETFKKKLSLDYQNIRKEALAMLEQKIILMKDELGADTLEMVKYEAAKEKINDDQWILDSAEYNSWELHRTQTKDLEEEDKVLARKLAESALDLH